jgi:hypothetical protein
MTKRMDPSGLAGGRHASTGRALACGVVAAGLLLVSACSSSSPSTQASTGSTPGSSAGTSGGATTGGSTPGSTPGGTAGGGAPVVRSAATGPVPTVTGPVTGGEKGKPNNPAPEKLLADAGYVEEEWFVAGDATSYQPQGEWGQDGKWSVTPGPTAPYVTRVLVRRPSSPAKFDGSVMVEWMNVTAGADVSVDFGYTNRELLEKGYIYVGVTAQKVGHDAAKNGDATRYASMVHPGDEYSYDIFTQAGRATLANKLFPSDFAVKRIIADGESQSASRMVTYINALQKQADVYDAFLVHSRSDRTTPVAAGQQTPTGALIRTDLRSPTLVVLTETDVIGNLKSKQDDSDTYRRWEIAGSAHVDNYDLAVLSGTDPNEPAGLGKICEKPINMAHQYWVMNAGLHHLDAWINKGPLPPKGDRLTVNAEGTAYEVDAQGNTKGGIRLPDVEAPIAVFAGLGNNPSFCRLYGSTVAFDAAKLAQLYPDHAAFVTKFDAAVQQLRTQGFMVDGDLADAKSYAQNAKVPS